MSGRTRPACAVVGWFGVWNRKRKASFVRRFIDVNRVESVLLVGVGEGWTPVDSMVEEAAASRVRRCIACDLHERSNVPWTYVRASGLALPFGDRSFDLVLSNAVIEHVGGESNQARFVREHARVGRHWIITTPNRWFPVESHTAAVFLHWSTRWRGRKAHLFTRLLSRREFRRLLPPGARIKGSWRSPTFLASSGVDPRIDG